jgi:hypothetical protein
MGRAVPAVELRRAFWPAILFRWLLWTLSIGLLSAGIPARLAWPVALALGGISGAYTLLWTLNVADLTRIASRKPAILLLDLLLSLIPTWLSGGQDGPLAPFALGALILPGMIYHWRGALASSLVFVALGAFGGWALTRLGLIDVDQEYLSVLLLRPLIAATVLPISDVLWRHRRMSHTPAARVESPPTRSAQQPRASLMRSMEAAAQARREAHPGTAAAVHLARPYLQTLERPRFADLYGAVRLAIAEAEEQGVRVRLLTQGRPPALPPGHLHLVARTIEVSLDNVRCHARTLEAEVSVTCTEDDVTITIRDHGEGLLDGTAEPPGFHQLRRLRYRVEEIEGSLLVREDVAGGVSVTVRVPSVDPQVQI